MHITKCKTPAQCAAFYLLAAEMHYAAPYIAGKEETGKRGVGAVVSHVTHTDKENLTIREGRKRDEGHLLGSEWTRSMQSSGFQRWGTGPCGSLP